MCTATPGTSTDVQLTLGLSVCHLDLVAPVNTQTICLFSMDLTFVGCSYKSEVHYKVLSTSNHLFCKHRKALHNPENHQQQLQ